MSSYSEFFCNFISLKIVIVNIHNQSPSSFILYLFDIILCKNAIISLRLIWNCFLFFFNILLSYHWPWWNYQWEMSTVSCPHQPTSAAVDSHLWLLVESVHLLLGLPHFLLPSVFLRKIIIFLQIILSFLNVPEVGQLPCYHSCLQQCFI